MSDHGSCEKAADPDIPRLVQFPPNPKRVRGRPRGSKNIKKGEIKQKPMKARGRPKGSKNIKKVVVENIRSVKKKRLNSSTALLPARILPSNHLLSFGDDPDFTDWTDNTVINQSLTSPEKGIPCLSEMCSSSIPLMCHSEAFLDDPAAGNNTMESTNESLPSNADVPSCIKIEMTDMETGFCYNKQMLPSNNASFGFNKFDQETDDVDIYLEKNSERIKTEPNSPEESPVNSITSITNAIPSNKEESYVNENISCNGKRKRIKTEHVSPEHSPFHSVIVVAQPNEDKSALSVNDSFEQIRKKVKNEPMSPGRSSIQFTSDVTPIKSNENELNNLLNHTSQNESKESHSATAEIATYSVSSEINHGEGHSEQTVENSYLDSNVTTCEYADAVTMEYEKKYLTDNNGTKQPKIKVEGNIHSTTGKKALMTSFNVCHSTSKSKSHCSNMRSNRVNEEFSTHSAAYLLMNVDFTHGDILECLDVLSSLKYPCDNSLDLFYDEEMEQISEPEAPILDNDNSENSFNNSLDVYTAKIIEAEYTTGCTLNQNLSSNLTYPKIEIDESVPRVSDNDRNQAASMNSPVDVDIEKIIKAEYTTRCTFSQNLSSNLAYSKVKTEVEIDESVPRVLDNDKIQTSVNSSVDVDIEKRIEAEQTTGQLSQKLSSNLTYNKVKTEVEIDESVPRVLDNDKIQTSVNSSVDVDIEKRIEAEQTTFQLSQKLSSNPTYNKVKTEVIINEHEPQVLDNDVNQRSFNSPVDEELVIEKRTGQKLSSNPTYPKIKTEESSMANRNYLNEGTAFPNTELHETTNNAFAVRTSTIVTNEIQDFDSKISPVMQSHNASKMQDIGKISNGLSGASTFSCTSSEVKNMPETYFSYQDSKQSSVQKLSVAEYLQRSFMKYSQSTHAGSIVCSKDLSRNIFPDRRGNESVIARSLYRNVGRRFVSSNDMYFLIIEWNSKWLYIQKETNLCPPICEQYHEVKDTYESIEEYYNTIFPLHLLSIWLEIYDSWNQDTSTISVKFENYEEKSHYVKIVCSNMMPNDNLSPCEGIYMVGSKVDRNDEADELFGYVYAIQAKKLPSSWKKALLYCYTAEKPNIGVNERVSIQKLCNIRVALIQNDALQVLSSSARCEMILNPKAHVSKIQLVALPPIIDTESMREGARRILYHATCSDNNITIVDTPQNCTRQLTILKLIELSVERRFLVLVCFKTEEMLLELAKYLRIRSLILAVKKSEIDVPEEFQQFLLSARAIELNITEEEVLKRCKIIFTVLSGFYLSNSANVFDDSNLACIIDGANLCSETETSLPLSYDPKYIVLMGSSTTQAEMHPRLQAYGYQQSLYSRLYKAKYEYLKNVKVAAPYSV